MSVAFYPRKGADGRPLKIDSSFASSHPPPTRPRQLLRPVHGGGRRQHAAARLGRFRRPLPVYSSVAYVRQRLSLAGRLKWMVGASLVNRRVNALRQQFTPVRA
jgi:hypothetical protein